MSKLSSREDMIEFKFKKTEEIIGKYSVEFVAVSEMGNARVVMSILQLAKIWGTDKKVTKNMGFGSVELEEQCVETSILIKKFPNVSVENNSLFFDNYSVHKSKKDILLIVEDLCGWGNEGIEIYMSEELYDFINKNRMNCVEVNSDSIKFLNK